ncbi:uncharacterized protein ACLA_040210 [Aspergillus clavatus NRRL 1]|uniref:CFEM domain-containing protein n=1 Tax=Aspergillus clavatus (strain ATCC 1007 / CBS 513.65 / DSM 816 / NCTC 3887 / NRRL 1 / QM 1276 / 107) TaxID=344612 RepID=A1CKY1_ASPCL|nr:uncharacterized protein ACLA_040210 [Aspergillus clavatus NRRL 1]EAW09805.1 conserved hypothetical protein [Aspergillus clavatus NRRL 1]
MFLPSIGETLIAISSLISPCVAHSSHKVRRIAPTASSALDSIPHCALKCVEAFIESDGLGSACASLDIGCLCRTNTQSGYTLGEAALRCNLSFCPMSVAESSHVYNICDTVPGAIPKTHATITATIMSTIYPTTGISTQTTTTTAETSSPTVIASPSVSTSSLPQSTSLSQSTPSTTSATFATFQTPLTLTHADPSFSSTTEKQSSSQTASGTATTTAEASGSSLNAAAVIGVSVTSGVSGFFILGVIIFFCCRRVRRRHQRIKNRDFFEIGGVMSEPPDFSQPLPRRPAEGPPDNPMSDATNQHSDSETARLMSPFKPTVRNPDVVVTTPDDYRFVYDTPDRIGFAVSTNSEFDASPSQASQRTISDLLPDKPNLYPEPLRWSIHKSRPASSNTLFEEEEAAKSRGSLGSANPYLGLTGGRSRLNNGHQYRQNPTMGLPSNPRAMLYGTEGARRVPPPKKSGQYGAKPVYANTGERVQFGQQAELCDDSRRNSRVRMPDQQDFAGNYWGNQNNGFGRPSPRGSMQRPVQGLGTTSPSLRDPGAGFETVNLNESSTPRRKSRHSGDFKPLTPVKEVRTPSGAAPRGEAQGYFNENATVQYPQMPFSAAVPPQEIVSRPRIVRRDDIKRVQIRKGKPQPQGLSTPYSPEDCWFTPSYDSGQRYSNGSKSRRLPVDNSYPVENMTSRVPARKPVSWGRKVTPSKRGSDLILRVD